jgi:hypothetical protein
MSLDQSAVISILSLVIALLAVFVGPWISLRIAREQTLISLAVANKEIIAPMRQAWIDKLRELTADVLSISWWYYVSGQYDQDEHSDDEEEMIGSRVERRLRFRLYQIELMLNPEEPDHQLLLESLKETVSNAFPGEGKTAAFPSKHKFATAQAKRVFKREWEVVKKEGMDILGSNQRRVARAPNANEIERAAPEPVKPDRLVPPDS